MEIYQPDFNQKSINLYNNLNMSLDDKYHPMYGGNKLGKYAWDDQYNISFQYGDFDYHGNGQFTYYINRAEGNDHYRFYNTIKVRIDLEPIYRLYDTPYYNAGNKNFKWCVADYPYCYGIIGMGTRYTELYNKCDPNTVVQGSYCSFQTTGVKTYLGPHPGIKRLPLRNGRTIKEWNVNYEHDYVGTKWVLNENQTYGEYYARNVYWWDEAKADDIRKLLADSQLNHGKLIGNINANLDVNQAYTTLLLSLLNHFSKIDRKNQHQDWVCNPALDTVDYYNLYGSKIHCDKNTRGLVIEIPRTRRGPVGRLFLPFINPADGYYTPTPHRCDFDHFLWYHIPWEKGNCLDYLMFTDTEVAEEGPEPNQVKACIATQRGHTRNNLPELSDASLAKLDAFWGFGYHYRIDPKRLFESGLVFKVSSLATFKQTEESVLKLIFDETGVMFPIDGNTLTYTLTENYLQVTLLLNGPRSQVYFKQTPMNIIIADKIIPISSLFKTNASQDNITVEYAPNKDGWITNNPNQQGSTYPLGILDLFNATYNLNVTRNSLPDGLKMNYDMFKQLKSKTYAGDQPIVLLQFIANVLNEKLGNYKWFCNNNDATNPSDGVVNTYACNILYNGPNTVKDSPTYYKRGGLSNILILEPQHAPIAKHLARYIMISYED